MDIPILITDREVKFTDYIHPACLWDGPGSIDDLAGISGKIVGWGEDERGQTTAEPMAVYGTIINDTECRLSSDIIEEVTTRRNFCASNRNNTGPWKGDSGGTFMLNHMQSWMVRGVVAGMPSSVLSMCDLTNVAIYTDVVKFKDWIKEESDKILL